MHLAAEHLDAMKARHHFEEWAASNTLDTNLFVWNPVLDAEELLGLESKLYQSVVLPDDREVIQSTWGPPGGGNPSVRIDVYVDASRVAARERLLERLSRVQVPGLRRIPETDTGDVLFRTDNGRLVLFGRSNLVVEVAALEESSTVDIAELAQAVDRLLTARPPGPSRGGRRRSLRGPAARDGGEEGDLGAPTRVGDRLPLDAHLPDLRELRRRPRESPLPFGPGESSPQSGPPSEDEPVPAERAIADVGDTGEVSPGPRRTEARDETLRFFADDGEVVLDDGDFCYVPGRAGPHELDVYRIDRDHNVAVEHLTVDVDD